MPEIKGVTQSRSVDGGHAIEVDFLLGDNSIHTLKIPYERIPEVVHATTAAAAVAETAQKVAISGQPQYAVIAPYRMLDVRTGHAPDGTLAIEFATPKGPVQVSMTDSQARKTIECLGKELENLGRQQFPKPS